MNHLTDEQLYKLSKKRVISKKIFNLHLIIYFFISLILMFISVYNNSWWFIYPLMGWGLFIIVHKFILNIVLDSNEDINNEFMKLKNSEELRNIKK